MAAQLANVQQKWDEYKVSLDKSLNDKSKPWYKGFQMVEEKTNVPRIYLFVGKCILFNISEGTFWESPHMDKVYVIFSKKKSLRGYEFRLNV